MFIGRFFCKYMKIDCTECILLIVKGFKMWTFEQKGIFFLKHVILLHGASINMVSSEGPLQLVSSKTSQILKTFSNQDPTDR